MQRVMEPSGDIGEGWVLSEFSIACEGGEMAAVPGWVNGGLGVYVSDDDDLPCLVAVLVALSSGIAVGVFACSHCAALAGGIMGRILDLTRSLEEMQSSPVSYDDKMRVSIALSAAGFVRTDLHFGIHPLLLRLPEAEDQPVGRA